MIYKLNQNFKSLNQTNLFLKIFTYINLFSIFNPFIDIYEINKSLSE
jgi:hypothetical protein